MGKKKRGAGRARGKHENSSRWFPFHYVNSI